MAEPVRKMPADREMEPPSPDVDPFRYGWRPRSVRLPSGEIIEEQVPLTLEDLLDPQHGDVVTQGLRHGQFAVRLHDMLRLHFADRSDVLVTFDMKMLWGIPGLPEPSPDVAVIFGAHLPPPEEDLTSFDVVEQGALPSLVVEVVSSTDAGTRNNDYEKKVAIYEKAGVPEYIIVDPPNRFTGKQSRVTGYRLGADRRYRRIEPDGEGCIFSETTNLRFGVEEDGRTPMVIDVKTGNRLVAPDDLKAAFDSEARARKAAEEREKAERQRAKAAEDREEAERQRAETAEAELIRLREEFERLKGAK